MKKHEIERAEEEFLRHYEAVRVAVKSDTVPEAVELRVAARLWAAHADGGDDREEAKGRKLWRKLANAAIAYAAVRDIMGAGR